MRVLVTGATGNIGTSVLQALGELGEVEQIVGLARRAPLTPFAKTRFVEADVTRHELTSLFRDVDAVVHLAWVLTPAHKPAALRRINVKGSERVFEAAAEAKVRSLVVASSIGAYAPGSKEVRVAESWPTTGIPSCLYSRQKAEVERVLDDFEARHPDVRVVRFRPALVFKRQAASEIRRLFMGRLVPRTVFEPGLLRLVPSHPDLVFQCVHSLDVGRAFADACLRDVRGAFNLAADPPIDATTLRRLLDAREVRAAPERLKKLIETTFKLHLQPSEGGWIDLAFQSPLVSAERARRELDWEPRYDAVKTMRDLFRGIRVGDGMPTPPLLPATARAPLTR